ncbi:hypothetical protein R5R35_010909 [Gryllus longicercus]|uniref:Intraflagellar transport protein 140 homolog n=1 Tax=Gryllus longicercus TaxID=2509291 RepID=A0AAN9YVM4_9ORTH
MSVFFDYKVQITEPSAVNVAIEWHPLNPWLAVSSYSQEKGGFVNICNELGEPLEDVTCPQHPVAQVTTLTWHPSKKLLVTGWENGEIRVWIGEKEFTSVESPHQVPIIILEWSEQGGRLVSGDTGGSLVGWKVDPRGHFSSVFHIDLKDAVTHIAFRKDLQKNMGYDLSGLARAAVAGDELALDMFSAWRPRTAGNRFTYQATHGDNLSLFVGSVSGIIYYITEDGSVTEVLNLEGILLKKMLYREGKDNLIVMTEGLSVGQFAVDAKGNLTEIMKVKLSGRSQDATMVWAGSGLLAISTGDLSIRCWDMDSGDNYLLEAIPSSAENASNLPTEIFTHISFNSQKGLLCGGSNLGRVCMWKSTGQQKDLSDDGDVSGALMDASLLWQVERSCQVRGSIKQLTWNNPSGLLAVNTISNVFLLREQILCSAYSQHVLAVQVGPSQLTIEVMESEDNSKGCSCDLKTDIQISGVTVTATHLAVWSKKTLVIYQLNTDYSGETSKITCKVVGSFSSEVEAAVLFEQSAIVLGEERVEVFSFSGAVKQTLALAEAEGKPLGLQLCGSFLCVATTCGSLRVWDLSRREAKPHTSTKNLEEDISDFGEIISACCNSKGTKVSITIAKSNFVPDTRLYLWDIETDTLSFFNFASGKMDKEEADDLRATPEGSAKSDESKSETLSQPPARTLSGRFVLSHQWDAEEPKLLVCEAKLLPKPSRNKDVASWPRRVSTSTVTLPDAATLKDQEMQQEVLLVTIFTTPEQGIILQDIFPMSSDFTKLLGVHTPHYLLLKKPSQTSATNSEKLIMRDFEGLQTCDKSTRDAVLHFSYNLSIGNMDEAFRAIKTVKSEAVWESLARMCVKTKRLDVASVCLGHMKHARGAMLLREAKKEPQLEAQVGMLAVQLGMLDEAERLYTTCGRFDLLNKMYQAAGEWEKALRVAEEQDRIHLRATYFNYACHLEAKGDYTGAAHMYERSDTHRFQVPRMLLEDPLSLENYIIKAKDPALTKWWAQYMESTGQMDLALQFYEEAQDYFSLVRVLCFQHDIEKAAEVASSSGDRAACYHLARHYEADGRISDAIHFFTRAEAYSNAVRICKEHGIEDQLWNLALLAGPREQLEAARYFESSERASPDKAVILFHRAGMLHKALDLAFKTQQYNALQHIAVDLNSNSDPALILKCAQFFVENKQFDKAVDLLAVGKQYVEALDLCLDKNIPVTEDLAEKLTMAKGEGDEGTRVRVLEKVAESAMAQGNYHLATKKFTQAGNKVKAMKALLKSGDTEKIIFFANVSRQREIYVMAANYLQSLDWQNDPSVLKNIVQFYSKGRAPELLANFYVACAQVEIDEYQNYEKALGALSEASRCLSKVSQPRDPKQHERAVENLNNRMSVVRRFVEIRRLFDRGDADTALSQCRQMLESYTDPNSDYETAVRRGDIYAVMVEHKVSTGDLRGAQQLIDEFRRSAPGANLPYYLGISTLEKVARGLGLPLSSIAPQAIRSDSSLHAEREDSVDQEEAEDIVEEEDIKEEETNYRYINGKTYAAV